MDTSRCSKCGNLSFDSPGPTFDVSVAPGTRHYTLLNTNEPPEDSESVFIRSVIAESSPRLKHLDNEISKLQEKLKQLEDERTALLSYRTRNTAILSPLRRMPPEVLAEIFSWTLPSVNDALSIGSDTVQSPWLLTRINSRWRAVCLSTTSLWSRIVFDYESSDPPRNYSLALAETHIHRAQNLHIHFYGCAKTDSKPQIEMFELLLKHSSRWEELALGITSAMLPLLAALRGRIPSLKRLWIQWESPQAEVQSLDCFQTAPSLVDFGATNSHHFVSIAFPAQQLTRYRLDGPLQRHLDILGLAQNLIQAHVIIEFDDGLRAEKTEIIRLPHLRCLFVSHPEALDYLEAPALEGLGFWVLPQASPQTNDIDIGHLESFLGRSKCPLRRLCLRDSDAHSTAQILGRFPSITEVTISDESHGQENFELLMSTLTSPEVAPQLRSLFFASEEGSGITDYSMYPKMLRTRWEADGSALKNAALLAEDSRPDSGMLRDLHALRREGLDLLILEGRVALREMYDWFYSSSWMV
ncbi:F-box domain-containing protein [Mycena sanguinolenta]|uniref:F-box domain-containing protein n=1 Tax=Mycena sanguinolenta TaxID=230812 RepID=A0A8H7D9V7_9AGAR|nr:F-box domain-containing protein [Mycena sanguinolenta]